MIKGGRIILDVQGDAKKNPKVKKHLQKKGLMVAGFASEKEKEKSISDEKSEKEIYKEIQRKQLRTLPISIAVGVLIPAAFYYLLKLFL